MKSTSIFKKLPDDIWRYIYKYIFDLSEIKKIKDKYLYKDNEYKYYFEQRYNLTYSYYHWTEHFITFPSIVSCYFFNKGYYEVSDFNIYDVDNNEQLENL